jgi:asparagine N-glycosylation enzyme membrane subunit Stt3
MIMSSEYDYGVMSWWDYGHIITYWGHRIPNAMFVTLSTYFM